MARMEPLARLPLFFDLKGRRVVLAGDSDAAAWKAELLSAAGAVVDVFAPSPAPTLLAVAAQPPGGAIHLHRRAWSPEDLKGAVLAIGALEDEHDAVAFAHAARDASVLVNSVDRPALCDFAFGSIVNRSPMVIGISTDGAAPALAQALRVKIETLVPQGLKRWAEAAKAWRGAIQAASASAEVRRRLWQTFAATAFARADEAPTAMDLAELLRLAAKAGPDVSKGKLAIVRIRDGDVGSLTLNSVRALQTADVVVHDDPASSEILELSRREAKTIGVAGLDADSVEALLSTLVAEGQRVVRLVS